MGFFRKSTPTGAPVPDFIAGAGIAFKNVSCYDAEGQRAIIRDVSAEFTARSTAILGLNGSGKSSLLKLINGIYSPSSGAVQVGGLDVSEHTALVRNRVGLLFSNPLAQLIMPTPAEDVELSLRSLISDAAQRRQRALELLDERGLGERAHASVYDLSGGEQQLVALTSVLAVEPDILLLDEPTTLLDLRNKHRLYELLAQLPQQLVISTHDLDLAARCEAAVVVEGGRIIAGGSATEMIASYELWCRQGFPSESPDAGGIPGGKVQGGAGA